LTQPLVVGDGMLIDVAKLVERAVGQLDALLADREPPVGVIATGHALADRYMTF
jgi:hypothetical protein